MKRFILKCLLLIAVTGVILYITSALYIRSNAFRILEMSEKEWTSEYHAIPDQIDVAVFGSSHAHLGFRFYPPGTAPFNFALSGQTPQYDLMQMLEYQDHIRPGGLVVLTVSYLSPFWAEHDNEFARKQPRYYRILSPEHITEFDWVEYCLSKYFPIMAQDLPTVFNSLFRPGSIISSQDGSKAIDVNTLPAQQTNIIKDHWKAKMSSFPDTVPVMMEAYRQMLRMCRNNGWTAVLVTPPYLEEYSDCFPEEFYPVFYAAVKDLCQEYDAPYLDYSHDESYAGQYDLYRDIDHLNLAGAEKFDAQFYSDLQRLGIWSPDQ